MIKNIFKYLLLTTIISFLLVVVCAGNALMIQAYNYNDNKLTRETVKSRMLWCVSQKLIYDINELSEDHPELELHQVWYGNTIDYDVDENYIVVYVNYMTEQQEASIYENCDIDPRIRLRRSEELIVLD
ncbi:MAG: hypothetical protein IIW34_00070 [Clostridia bacterium]|nr:hypothetical protein [Clostridia bacterium]MBQ2325985.1 hypothetical protein [Clostridia bacterium]MBQ5812528.1 hypothetical protein [Clostridia bacterium]